MVVQNIMSESTNKSPPFILFLTSNSALTASGTAALETVHPWSLDKKTENV